MLVGDVQARHGTEFLHISGKQAVRQLDVRRITRIDEQQEGGLRLHQAAVGVFAFDMAAQMNNRFTF